MHDGPITQWLAIIGAVSLIYWGWRLFALLRKRAPEAARPAPPPAAPDNDIAVIAAAVFAVLGSHRILHIEADGPERNWVAEGRWMHQTSHRPHA